MNALHFKLFNSPMHTHTSSSIHTHDTHKHITAKRFVFHLPQNERCGCCCCRCCCRWCAIVDRWSDIRNHQQTFVVQRERTPIQVRVNGMDRTKPMSKNRKHELRIKWTEKKTIFSSPLALSRRRRERKWRKRTNKNLMKCLLCCAVRCAVM